MGDCQWPNGTCACYMQEQSEPDPYGRVWMHCDCGLSFTKSSMTRFIMFCVGNNVEIGDIMVFGGNPPPPKAAVVASVRIHPDKIGAFERETGGTLKRPPKVCLN